MIQNKYKLLISLIIVLLIPFLNLTRVVEVIDGDTIIVNNETIRLVGINAPEIEHKEYDKKGECFGEESKEFLTKEIKGKFVFIDRKGEDKYGRTLGFVYLGFRNVNLDMVKNGYAFVYEYEDFEDKKDFYDAEKISRQEKLNLWSAECDYYFK